MECLHTNSPSLLQHFIRPSDVLTVSTIRSVIIPELSEPPVRTLGATIPENESRLFR